jgi:hypothetical protein
MWWSVRALSDGYASDLLLRSKKTSTTQCLSSMNTSTWPEGEPQFVNPRKRQW